MQLLMIAGNVGNVKAIHRNQSGDPVLNFSVAVDNGKDSQGNKRDATWYDCALWGKRAESLAPYITKGVKLSLAGRPSARAHDGKAYLGITVNELTFHGGGEGKAERGQDEGRGNASSDMDDEVPF